MHSAFAQRKIRVQNRSVEDANVGRISLLSRDNFDIPDLAVDVLAPNRSVEGDVDDFLNLTDDAQDIAPFSRASDRNLGPLRTIQASSKLAERNLVGLDVRSIDVRAFATDRFLAASDARRAFAEKTEGENGRGSSEGALDETGNLGNTGFAIGIGADETTETQNKIFGSEGSETEERATREEFHQTRIVENRGA